jgi:hypothetical protein
MPMEKGIHTRKFNGKKYARVELVKTKREAQKQAKTFRFLVRTRVLKVKDGYGIYIRPTRNQVEIVRRYDREKKKGRR